MKFAFVLFKFLPFGGMQRNMLAIARQCVERGHEVTVLCSHWQGPAVEQIEAVELPPKIWEKMRGNGAQMRAFFQRYSAWLREHPQDLVVGFNKFPGLDVYYAADSCFAHKAREEKSWLYRRTPRARVYLDFERAVFAPDSSTRILEVSPKERARFQQQYQTPDERFYTLPPGIGRDRVAAVNYLELRQQIREELGIDGAAKVILAVGSGFRTKGLDRSIRLLADWKDRQETPAILLVAGADKEASFRQQASRLGLADKVIFLGGRSDVPALFQAADVVIHPAYKENTGNVLLEAMIAGRPVVATDVCGYAHYIEEARMGKVLPSPFTADTFYTAVQSCLDTPDQQWRERGAAFATRDDIYSRPAVAAQLLEQFSEEKEFAAPAGTSSQPANALGAAQ